MEQQNVKTDRKEYMRKYREANREYYREYQKEYNRKVGFKYQIAYARKKDALFKELLKERQERQKQPEVI